MDPTEAVNVFEVSFRELIRLVWGGHWLAKAGWDVTALEEKRDAERKSRRGAIVPVDLLEYAEFTQLTNVVLRHWGDFEPALGKRKYMGVYIERLNNLRNAPMHSRELLPFERELLSGIVGEVVNQITIYRSAMGPDKRHYPVIDSVVDSLGSSWTDQVPPDGEMRLRVGQHVTLSCRGTDPQGRELAWKLGRFPLGGECDTATGSSVSLTWTVEATDVRENRQLILTVTSDGEYHRHAGYDDRVFLAYRVDPPG